MENQNSTVYAVFRSQNFYPDIFIALFRNEQKAMEYCNKLNEDLFLKVSSKIEIKRSDFEDSYYVEDLMFAD